MTPTRRAVLAASVGGVAGWPSSAGPFAGGLAARSRRPSRATATPASASSAT
ncbi:hypothetical protein ACFQL4_17765 [Halosimplex aquaticum]